MASPGAAAIHYYGARRAWNAAPAWATRPGTLYWLSPPFPDLMALLVLGKGQKQFY